MPRKQYFLGFVINYHSYLLCSYWSVSSLPSQKLSSKSVKMQLIKVVASVINGISSPVSLFMKPSKTPGQKQPQQANNLFHNKLSRVNTDFASRRSCIFICFLFSRQGTKGRYIWGFNNTALFTAKAIKPDYGELSYGVRPTDISGLVESTEGNYQTGAISIHQIYDRVIESARAQRRRSRFSRNGVKAA